MDVFWDINSLKYLINLQTLIINFLAHFKNLSYIHTLTQLTNLSICACSDLKNISHLKNLTQITDLEISGGCIDDITPIKYLTNLTHLNLNNNLIKNSAIFHTLKKLKLVSIDHRKYEVNYELLEERAFADIYSFRDELYRIKCEKSKMIKNKTSNPIKTHNYFSVLSDDTI